MPQRAALVEGDGGIDGAGPGVDAAGDGLGLVEALLAEPRSNGEGARAVVAKDQDVGLLIELLMGAAGDLVHGEEGAAFDVGRGVLPGLADVEEERWSGRREEGLELGYGDFEIHGKSFVR
jgi:hypothetical protein